MRFAHPRGPLTAAPWVPKEPSMGVQRGFLKVSPKALLRWDMLGLCYGVRLFGLAPHPAQNNTDCKACTLHDLGKASPASPRPWPDHVYDRPFSPYLHVNPFRPFLGSDEGASMSWRALSFYWTRYFKRRRSQRDVRGHLLPAHGGLLVRHERGRTVTGFSTI